MQKVNLLFSVFSFTLLLVAFCGPNAFAITDRDQALRAVTSGFAHPAVREGEDVSGVERLFTEALEAAEQTKALQSMDADRLAMLNQMAASLAATSARNLKDERSPAYLSAYNDVYRALTAPRYDTTRTGEALDQAAALVSIMCAGINQNGKVDDPALLPMVEKELNRRLAVFANHAFGPAFKAPLSNAEFDALADWLTRSVTCKEAKLEGVTEITSQRQVEVDPKWSILAPMLQAEKNEHVVGVLIEKAFGTLPVRVMDAFSGEKYLAEVLAMPVCGQGQE